MAIVGALGRVAASEPHRTIGNDQTALVAVTPNFVVRSFRQGPNATEIAQQSESLRQQIHNMWFGEECSGCWQPRCEITLHATKGSYLRAVGLGAGQTSGCSLVERQRGRIVGRRIDLVVDQHGRATALPHELTHVVLADWSADWQLPCWMDEGIATLADSDDKLARHQRDCDHAILTRTAFDLADLLTGDGPSSPGQFPAFYGQSVSLVRFLATQDEPSRLLPFARLAMRQGYDEALRRTYGIDGVSQLQHLWLSYAASSRGGQSRQFMTVGLAR